MVLDLPFENGSLAALESLQKMGKYKLVWTTAQYEQSSTWAHDRLLWMKNNIFHISDKYVFTPHKELVEGDVLIDDKPENCFNFYMSSYKRKGILLDQPWNRNTQVPILDRARGWDEVIKKLI